jgi:putative endonuclease
MYILECADGTYYVGSTRDLNRRVLAHQQGIGSRYTARRLPVKLVYAEEYNRIRDAYARERQIHNWGHEKKKALVEGRLGDLSVLAKKKFEK